MSLLALVLTAATAASPAAAEPVAAPAKVTKKTIASNLQVPWGIAFLPDGSALVSERAKGDIRRVPANGGTTHVVKRIADADPNSGEGGLLGLAVSPTYKRDKLVYAYYTSREGGNKIVRFKLAGGPMTTVLDGIESGGIHNGGRIAFGPDGKLYAGVGETGDTGLSQQRDSLNGKILRINPDGSIPDDNPFQGSPVWSLGHRNVQGLAWDRQGRLWATEFGQNTTDEVNLIRPGKNYGWPVREGREDTEGGKYTNPRVTWSPTSTASPSGDAIVGNTLYVAALAGEGLFKVKLSGAKAGKPQKFFTGHGRIRTVVKAPGGGLWVATSNADGRGTPQAGDDHIFRIPAS